MLLKVITVMVFDFFILEPLARGQKPFENFNSRKVSVLFDVSSTAPAPGATKAWFPMVFSRAQARFPAVLGVVSTHAARIDL